MRHTALIAALVISILAAEAPAAQWLHYPTAGVPRLPDGKPNLGAPTPRTADGKPDLSGMWQVANLLPCNDDTRVCTDLPISAQFGNIGAGLKEPLPYQEWAKERIRTKGSADNPYTRCLG